MFAMEHLSWLWVSLACDSHTQIQAHEIMNVSWVKFMHHLILSQCLGVFIKWQQLKTNTYFSILIFTFSPFFIHLSEYRKEFAVGVTCIEVTRGGWVQKTPGLGEVEEGTAKRMEGCVDRSDVHWHVVVFQLCHARAGTTRMTSYRILFSTHVQSASRAHAHLRKCGCRPRIVLHYWHHFVDMPTASSSC